MEKASSTGCYLGEDVCREWHLNAHSVLVLTCEGSIGEKGFRKKLEGMVSAMCRMLKIGGDDVSLKMVEPWNSVRVTFTIPRDAAQRLRQLAQGNPQQLRELGILSVQIEGEGVVRLAPVQTQHLENRSSGAAAASAAAASSLPNPTAAPAGRGMQSVPGSRPPGHQPAPVMWSRMPGQSYSHMQHGSMQQGSMQQGSMQQGSMQQGSMQQGSMQQGSMQQGSMQQGSMQQGSMQQGSMQQGSMQQGSMQQGSMQQGSMQQGSMQQGSMQQGSMQQGSMQQGSMQQGSMQQGSMQQGSMQQGSMQQGSMSGMAMQTFQNNAQVPSQFHRPMMTPSTAPPHPPPPYPFGSQQVSAGVQSHFMMAHSSSAPKMSPMLQNKPSGNALPPTSQASLQQGPPPGHMTHYPPVMSSPIQPQRRLEQPGVRNRLPFGMSAVQSNPGGPAPNHENMAPVPTTSQMENRGHMQSTPYHMTQNAVKFEVHHTAQGPMQASVGEAAGAAPAALGHAQQESQSASRGNKPVPFHGSTAVSTIKDQRLMNAADMREAAKDSMKQNAGLPRVAHVVPTKHEGDGRGPTGSQQTLGNVGNVPRGAMGAQQDKGPPTPRGQAKAAVTQLELGSCQPGQVASAGSQREVGAYVRRAAASGGGQQDVRNASWGSLGNQSSSEINAAGSSQVVASGNQQDAGNALHRQSDAQFDGLSQSQVPVSCNPVGAQREEHPPNTMAKTEVQLVTTTKSQMVALQNQVPGAQGQVMNVTSHIRAVTSASESVPESVGTVEKSSATGHGNVRKSPCAALTQQLITGVSHGNQTPEFQGRGQGASAGSASEQAEGQEQGGRGPRVRSAGTPGSDPCPPGAPLEPALVGERASPTSGGVVVGRFPAPALPYGFSAGAMNPTSAAAAAAAAAAATRAQAAASLANKDVTLTSPLLVNLLQSDITSSQFAHGNKQGANGANRKKPVRNQKKKNPPGRQDKVQSSSDGDAALDVQLQEKTKVEPSEEHENTAQHGVSMQGASSKMNEQHQSDVQSSFQLNVQRDVADPTREVSEMTEHHLPQKQNVFDSYDPSSATLELPMSGPPATSGHDLQPLKPQVAPTILNPVEIPRSLPLYGPSAMYSAGQNAPIGPNNAAVCEKGPQPLGADVAGSSSFSQEKSETIMPSIKEESCAMVENKPNNHFGRDDHSKARHLQTSPTACAGSAASPFSQGQSLPAANIKFGGSTRDLSQLASPGQIGQQGNTSVQILHGGTRIAFSSNTVPSQTPLPVSSSQHQALSAPLGTLQTSVSRPKTPNRASPRPYNAIPPSFCPPSTEPSEISLSPERLNASIAGLFPPQINVPLPPKQPCLNARTLEQQGLNPTTLKAIGQVPGNQSAFPQMPGGVSVKSEEPYQERQTSIGVKRSSPSSRKGTQCTVKKSIPSPNRKLSVTGTRRAGDSPGAQINKHSLQHSILTSAPDKNASFMNEPLVRNIYLPTLPNFKSSVPAAEPLVAEVTPTSIPQMKSPSSLLQPGVGENILKHNLSYAPLPFTGSTTPSPSLSSELENPAVASAHKPPLWPTPSNYEECFAGNTTQPAMGFGTRESKSVDSVVSDEKNATVIHSSNASLQIHTKSPERNNGNGDALQLLNSEATNKHDAKISFRETNEPIATTLMVNPTERPEEQSCSSLADGSVVDTHAKPVHVIPPEKRGAADTSSMKNDSSLSSPPSCAQDQMVSEKMDNVDILCSSDTTNPVSSEPSTSKSGSIPVIEPSNTGEREKESNSTNVNEAVVHSAVSKTEQPEQSTAPQDVTVKHESDSNITSCDITSSISSESAKSSAPVESPAAKSSMDVSPERKNAEFPEPDNKSYLESQSCHTSANDQQATSDASKVASSSFVSECSSSAESTIGSGIIQDAGAVPCCKKSHRAKTPFESGIGEQLESSEKDEPSAITSVESQSQLVGPTDNTAVSTDVTLEDHSSTSTSDDAGTQSQSTDVVSSSIQEAAAGESAVDTAGDKSGAPMESELSAKTTVEVDKTSRNKQKEKDPDDSGVQQEMDVLQRKRSTRSASYCVARDISATGSHAPSKRKKK
ncbi:uncharacterized protein LOC116942509 [Petromyzon marinus]|uniref:uncharacterized protein LOC116942509 n=1 Tax=Petromyzon marinus TaxID=7757 RepID=UPI003F712CBB